MATAPEIPSAKFLATDQIIADLLDVINGDTPDAIDLRDLLKITSNCDYPAQLAAQLNNKDSVLQKFIRENFHPNQGVSTLGAATRLFFNPKSQAPWTAADSIVRNEADPNVILGLRLQKQLNAHVHVKDPGFVLKGNRVEFNRVGTYAVNLQLKLAIWGGVGTLTTAPAPAWRFSDTPANRSLTVTPFIRIYGSLVGGRPSADIRLLPVLITKEMVETKDIISVGCRATFKALTGSDVYGRIEAIEVGLDRGNTVAYFAGRPDSVGPVKSSSVDVEDFSNFIDLVEI